MYQSFFHF